VTLVDVAALAELEVGVPTVREVNGREVVLVRTEDSVHAVRNVCPHQSQSFVKGSVRPRLVGGARLGDVVVDGRPLLACPWHSWTFDLADGQCAVDPKLRIGVYSCQVQDGRVMIEVATARP
jgi:nitrite reductase/ring-hydroxylating ferredoxin subunit